MKHKETKQRKKWRFMGFEPKKRNLPSASQSLYAEGYVRYQPPGNILAPWHPLSYMWWLFKDINFARLPI